MKLAGFFLFAKYPVPGACVYPCGKILPVHQLERPATKNDGKTVIAFHHKKGSHCESIVTSNLLSHYGLELSEPLIFGIGSGLFFAYLPYNKLYGIPLTTFRNSPGKIFLNCVQRLKLKIELHRFYLYKRNAMDDLDDLLDRGIPTALQVGVYWLPFLPWAMQLHFNAHH